MTLRAQAVFVFCAAAVLVGCSKPNPDIAVSVTDVLENIHNWDGRIVTVNGWLGKCEGYDCRIFPTLSDARIVAKGEYESDAWDNAMDRGLGVGFDEKFDRAAKSLQFKPVKLKAKVSDECRGWMVACTDRAPDLYPISIQPNLNVKDN